MKDAIVINSIPLADPKTCALLVVDMQERLMPHIDQHESVVASAVKIIRAAKVLSVPVLVTEQNPEGLGPTVQAVRDVLPPDAVRMVKETFSCCGDATFRERQKALQRRQVVVVGIEAHVCVQQTVLEMLAIGRHAPSVVPCLPFVLADAVGSRRANDHDIAVRRMEHAGAVVTTAEAMIMELQQRYTTPTFRQILEIIR